FDYILLYKSIIFFFFSSRRRHTRCYRDWSSDVCSSDLNERHVLAALERRGRPGSDGVRTPAGSALLGSSGITECAGFSHQWRLRSEERRVGKECGSWVWRENEEKRP